MTREEKNKLIESLEIVVKHYCQSDYDVTYAIMCNDLFELRSEEMKEVIEEIKNQHTPPLVDH